jgi:hypothetical protein
MTDAVITRGAAGDDTALATPLDGLTKTGLPIRDTLAAFKFSVLGADTSFLEHAVIADQDHITRTFRLFHQGALVTIKIRSR